LEDDSPLPTKRLREYAELSGRENERGFTRGMRELSSKLFVVGFGEVEEGGFPSLAAGASRLLFEDAWDRSRELDDDERSRIIERAFPPKSAFRHYYDRLWRGAVDVDPQPLQSIADRALRNSNL
jgi:hypothetical protein